MKITELDLKTEGKRYKCGNSMFVTKNGDLFDVEMHTYLKDECIPVAELIEMEFREVEKMKNPYARVDYKDWYYAIERVGSVTSLADNSDYDNRMFNIANYFNNKEYAEYVSFKEDLMRKMDKFAWEHNARVTDWNNILTKFHIIFNHDNNEPMVDWSCAYACNNVHFTSKEIADKALEEFKDDLIKLYTWKFDV